MAIVKDADGYEHFGCESESQTAFLEFGSGGGSRSRMHLGRWVGQASEPTAALCSDPVKVITMGCVPLLVSTIGSRMESSAAEDLLGQFCSSAELHLRLPFALASLSYVSVQAQATRATNVAALAVALVMIIRLAPWKTLQRPFSTCW